MLSQLPRWQWPLSWTDILGSVEHLEGQRDLLQPSQWGLLVVGLDVGSALSLFLLKCLAQV